MPVHALINFLWPFLSALGLMAPQTTRRGWSDLRLEGMLVVIRSYTERALQNESFDMILHVGSLTTGTLSNVISVAPWRW